MEMEAYNDQDAYNASIYYEALQENEISTATEPGEVLSQDTLDLISRAFKSIVELSLFKSISCIVII